MRTRAIVSTLLALGWLVACSGAAERSGPSSASTGDVSKDVGTPGSARASKPRLQPSSREKSRRRSSTTPRPCSRPIPCHSRASSGTASKLFRTSSLTQGSELRLNDAELEKLGQNGFVISSRLAYPSFPYAYAAIYVHDLPVFVSGDMVLEALHRLVRRHLAGGRARGPDSACLAATRRDAREAFDRRRAPLRADGGRCRLLPRGGVQLAHRGRPKTGRGS